MKGLKVTGIKAYQQVVRLVIKIVNFGEPETLSGAGSVLKLADCLKEKGFRKPLIVTDRGIIAAGLLKGMCESFESAGLEYDIFDEVVPNPTIEVIEAARESCLSGGCDCLIGFGGGSSMDTAKVAAARISNPRTSIMKMTGYFKIRRRPVPVIAVPTTSGTGSECTVAAVITNSGEKAKYSVASPKLMPAMAVMDPELSYGLPAHITSTTGMDALTHAVEAYISTIPLKESDEYARKAVKLVFENLETCFSTPSDTEARENMMWASYYGGAAFTRAMVGNVHAVAHNLGGMYHVPHGLANAIVLPHVLDACKDSCEKRLARLAGDAGIPSEGKSERELAEHLVEKIRELNRKFDIPETVKELKEEDIPLIARRASREAFYLYAPPAYFSPAEKEIILKKMLPAVEV